MNHNRNDLKITFILIKWTFNLRDIYFNVFIHKSKIWHSMTSLLQKVWVVICNQNWSKLYERKWRKKNNAFIWITKDVMAIKWTDTLMKKASSLS